MKEAPLHEAKDDLSRYLRDAEKEEIVITRRGKPAGGAYRVFFRG
jgi:prevent-host-death family protein